MSVTVTGGEICVTELHHFLSYPSGGLPVNLPREIVVDEGAAIPMVLESRSAMHKVGSCHGIDAQRTTVWADEIRACVPNGGKITATTHSILVRKPKVLLDGAKDLAHWTLASSGGDVASTSAEPRPPAAKAKQR